MHALTQEAFRQEPRFTKFAFDRLLEWLDDGIDSHGETYLEMHRRLVSYFDRRNRPSPDELADETLNRIARTLAEGRRHRDQAARPLLLCGREVRPARGYPARSAACPPRRTVPLPAPAGTLDEAPTEPGEALAAQEQRLECLEGCLQKLTAEQRELIVEYYRDGRGQQIERRRDMAKRLGITMNALGIRACRIRSTLESCVEACRKER